MKSKRKKITLKDYAEDKAALRISYHEKVCAERMKTLFKAIDEMRKDIKELKTFLISFIDFTFGYILYIASCCIFFSL